MVPACRLLQFCTIFLNWGFQKRWSYFDRFVGCAKECSLPKSLFHRGEERGQEVLLLRNFVVFPIDFIDGRS